MKKVLNFLKENKLAVLSIAVFALVFIFLALPGQFAHFDPFGAKDYNYKLNGYEFFFNLKESYLGNKLGNKVVGSGIAIICLIPVSIVFAFLGRKSSFFVLLAALADIAVAVLFFTMESAAVKAYPSMPDFEGKYFCGWVPYFLGAIVVLLGIYLGYKTFVMMKDEIKHPDQGKKGPSYSYLKK